MSDEPTSSPRPRRPVGRVLVVLLVALVAAGAYGWHCHLDTYHLATVDPGVLYRDGLQSPCQFETALRKVNPKTVVSLISPEEQADPQNRRFELQANVLAEKGIRLVNLPIAPTGWPTDQDVDAFVALVTDPSNQPVLVHGTTGVRRTGILAAAYQMKVLGYDRARAKAEVLTFGQGPETARDVHRFIDAYDPAGGKVPQNLMPLPR